MRNSIYKLKGIDLVSGFTGSSILNTYQRLCQRFSSLDSQAAKPSQIEHFPADSVLEVNKGLSLDPDTSQTLLDRKIRDQWLGRRSIAGNYVGEEELLRFARAMFASWDRFGEGQVPVETAVQELSRLGLGLDPTAVHAVSSL